MSPVISVFCGHEEGRRVKSFREAGFGALAVLAWASLAQADESVWQWYGRCAATQQMRVDVQLDGRALYSKAFPACAMPREDIPAESPQKVLEFSLRGPAALFGAECERLGTVMIVGNIWRAGGEADALLLGVSFATPDHVLLNSLHVAAARHGARSTMAKRIVVRSSAVRNEPAGHVRE